MNPEGIGQCTVSVTGTGLTDLVIARFGAASAFTVSVAVTGVIPVPLTVAVFVTAASMPRGAYSFNAAS